MAGADLIVCDVAPRDGLQNLTRRFTVAERIELIERLGAAGLARIEAVSFVNPARVPAMADAEAVLAGLTRRAGTELAGLVLNARGAERALATDLDEIRFVVVASETFSRRNQGAGMAQALATWREISPAVRRAGRRLTGVVAAAFGCPYEGPVPASRVADIVRALVEAKADEIVLADTIGAGVPTQVEALAAKVRPHLRGARLGFHFHNTRNTGYANSVVALRAGATLLDASVGGLGGCPFAPRATGNIATEDLVHMLGAMGIDTGVDLDRLIGIVEWLAARVPSEVAGLVARAGAFPPARPALVEGGQSS